MKRNRNQFWHNTRWSGLILIVAICALWEFTAAYGLVNSTFWPRFSDIVISFVQLLVSGELFTHLMRSLYRMIIGYGIAVVCAVGLGLLMGFSRPIHNLLEPLTEILRPIPPPAYIPLVMLFFGIDDEMKIFVIAFGCFFPILLNTYGGVRAVDPIQINTGRTFGLRNSQIIRQIVIPAASPYIVTGMRISLAIALILVVISEMVTSNDGVGFFILDAQRSFRVKEMYAGIMMLAIVGYCLNYLFLAFEAYALSWHRAGRE